MVFRCIAGDGTRSPIEPSASPHGRFNDGRRLVLYTASSADGACAEYFRRRPELLPLQARVKLRVVQVSVSAGSVLNVTTADRAEAAGIAAERLVSSDADEDKRYRECRELADRVDAAGGNGIQHLNAALRDGKTWNAALFGTRSDGWEVHGDVTDVATPTIDAASVHAL